MLSRLTTALERELGLEIQVAKDVEEVAEDTQPDLEQRRMVVELLSLRPQRAALKALKGTYTRLRQGQLGDI